MVLIPQKLISAADLTKDIVPDDALRSAIVKALAEAELPISPEGLTKLKGLQVLDAGIESLTGLEIALSLETLDLSRNNIEFRLSNINMLSNLFEP